MHPNPIFRKETTAQNLAFAKDRGFGVLSINGPQAPLAAHVPFVLDEDHLELHLVRSNPIARLLKDSMSALLTVSGPDSYISPDWYEMDHDQVPTWNYVAVHLRGDIRALTPKETRGHLERLSDAFESRLPKAPWKVDKMPDATLTKLMRMIVPCKMVISEVEGTWKLNQNKPADARRLAAQEVEQSPIGQNIQALAQLMRTLE